MRTLVSGTEGSLVRRSQRFSEAALFRREGSSEVHAH
jgi:hypothetical protein